MERKIFFEDARTNVLEFFSLEFPTLNIEDVDRFISMFYKLVNYEEESQKIRPTILITSNINSIVRNVQSSKKILFYEDQDMCNFKARIKALMCFCRNDWTIYVNFGENIVEYGIIKKMTSLKDKSLIQEIKKKATLETISRKTNLIILNVYGGGVCELVGARGNKCSVCFNLNSQSEYNWDNEISDFVDACVSKIKTTPKKLQDIRTLITNIFYRVLRDLHGTICLVIDKDYKDKNNFLSDGTWLKEPIEFGKMFLRSSKVDENILRSYADVLTTMLDFDGITIIDNAGRIRAYNVFVEANNDTSKKIVGGARRRAALSVLQNKNKKIIGVYFQSQDGDNFYKEKGDLRKKKKKVRIVGGEVVGDTDDMLPLEIIAKLQLQKKKEEEQQLAELEKARAKAEKEKLEQEKVKQEQLEKEQLEKSKTEDNNELQATQELNSNSSFSE
ncbi:MAG: hypothetical protein E7356_04610 [Clostridiales bacterium]|nr:hypothetical protein [Clostridiales bacterium]